MTNTFILFRLVGSIKQQIIQGNKALCRWKLKQVKKAEGSKYKYKITML